MHINFSKELEPGEYSLDLKDYSESFRNEIFFEKKLNIFLDFMQQLLEEKDTVEEWVDGGWFSYSSEEAKKLLRHACNEFLEMIEN